MEEVLDTEKPLEEAATLVDITTDAEEVQQSQRKLTQIQPTVRLQLYPNCSTEEINGRQNMHVVLT
jgi:hypothetical protein